MVNDIQNENTPGGVIPRRISLKLFTDHRLHRSHRREYGIRLTAIDATGAPPRMAYDGTDNHDAAVSITGGFTFAVSDPQPYRISALRGHRNGSGQKLFQGDRLL